MAEVHEAFHRFVAITPHKVALLCLTQIRVLAPTQEQNFLSDEALSKLAFFLITQLKTNDDPAEKSCPQLMAQIETFPMGNLIAQALRQQLEALAKSPDDTFEFLQDLPGLFEAPDNTQPPLVRNESS